MRIANYLAITLICAVVAACGGTATDPVKPNQLLATTSSSNHEAVVQQLYVSYFGRPADPGGLANFKAQLAALGGPADIQLLDSAYKSNSGIKALVDSFGSSAESAALYTGSNTDFITAIYTNVLNRAPDQAGLAYWVGKLDSKELTRANASLSIMAGALLNASEQGQRDAALINAKISVARNFTTALNNAPVNGYHGDSAAAQGRALLSGVSASTDTAQLQATVDTLVTQLAANGILFELSRPVKVLAASIVVPPPAPPAPLPDVPASIGTGPADSNLKLWFFDPRTKLGIDTQGIFIKAKNSNYKFVGPTNGQTVFLKLDSGQYEFDALEPNELTGILVRKTYAVDVAQAAPPSLPDSSKITIPPGLAAAPSGSTLKLWIFDPGNLALALGSPGVFVAPIGGNFNFYAAAADGSVYLSLAAGDYEFEAVEPDGRFMARHRYKASISAAGVASITGLVPDARGIFPVTLEYAPAGAVTVAGRSPDSRGFFAVSAELVATGSTVAQQRRAALLALASEPASTFKPTSACQLIDQVTPNRGISADLSAGFPRVRVRLPAKGHIRALIVPVDFSDVPGTDDPAALYTPIANSVRDFYLRQSYGQAAFDFEVLPKWVRMPFLATKYNLGGNVGAGDSDGYRKEMVDLTQSLIDYSQYDTVYFFAPKDMPWSVIASGPAITSPLWIDNGYIINGASNGADMFLRQNGVNAARNWMAHETGHTFGLYDEDLNHAAPSLGSWSVMANSWTDKVIEHNAWDRYLIGWLNDSMVTCLERGALTTAGTTVKLNPLVRQNGEVKAAMVPLSASKILVMESRKNEGLDSMAANLEGVLVYTVDMKVGQLKGGYQTQRRPGSTDYFFEDAALRSGDSITVDGVVVTVVALSGNGDTVKVGIK